MTRYRKTAGIPDPTSELQGLREDLATKGSKKLSITSGCQTKMATWLKKILRLLRKLFLPYPNLLNEYLLNMSLLFRIANQATQRVRLYLILL
jgi:hypothetical protein